MSTHNKCFCGEIRKLLIPFGLKKHHELCNMITVSVFKQSTCTYICCFPDSEAMFWWQQQLLTFLDSLLLIHWSTSEFLKCTNNAYMRQKATFKIISVCPLPTLSDIFGLVGIFNIYKIHQKCQYQNSKFNSFIPKLNISVYNSNLKSSMLAIIYGEHNSRLYSELLYS